MRQRKFKKSEPKTIYRFVFIEGSYQEVVHEAMRWGRASWWPTDIDLRMDPEWQDQPSEGSAVRISLSLFKFLRPLTWAAKVTQVRPPAHITMTFEDPVFLGYMTLKVEERANGARVEFETQYVIQKPLTQILWNLLGRKKYEKSVEKILAALKAHCLKKFREEEERKYEG